MKFFVPSGDQDLTKWKCFLFFALFALLINASKSSSSSGDVKISKFNYTNESLITIVPLKLTSELFKLFIFFGAFSKCHVNFLWSVEK